MVLQALTVQPWTARACAWLCAAAAATTVCLSAHCPALAQDDPEQARRQALRRTPVVEVYQNWKDSVVCVTGAMVQGKRPSIEEFFRGSGQQQVVGSLGSGLVVHEQGYILTNAHAVEGVIAPEVTFDVRSRQYPAEVVSFARDWDLALLKIDAGRRLKAVRLAQAADVMIGETVVVIANPHGLIHTCTAGVLSATERTAQPEGSGGVTLRRLLQTDAGLNPGSSGGPWFNVLGEVIGISTAVRPDSQGIGFAVPVAAIRKNLPEMLDIERRQGITSGMVLRAAGPCAVTAVLAGSAAAQAGVAPGDVLVEADGRPILTSADCHLALVGHKPGETIALRLLRDGKPWRGTLTLGARPMPDGAALLRARLGLSAVPLDAAKARAMALRVDRGVVVAAVEPGLYDAKASAPMAGDVLAQIDGIRPRDLEHAGLLLDRLTPKQPVHVVLLRVRGTTATRVDLSVTPRQ